MKILSASFLLSTAVTCATPALAESLNFTTASAVSGQIDWAAGPIDQFGGKVVVLISPPGTYDRDGWAGVGEKNRRPYLDIAEALVAKGYAVARFDNPGVLPAERTCGDFTPVRTAGKWVGHKDCKVVPRSRSVAEAQYQSSVDDVLATVRKTVPAATGNTVLFAIGEGAALATQAAAHAPDRVIALVSLGGGRADRTALQHQAETLAVARMPLLFIRGARDGRPDVRDQLERLSVMGKEVGLQQLVQYEGRYRLLSKRGDAEWFEASAATTVAENVDGFLAKVLVAK